jgi:hypothetical protein
MGRGMHQATLDLVDQARRVLEENQPATVRAVCYRLFVAGAIDSMEKKNTQKVGRALVYARENDLIPWEWIVDETRSVERTPLSGTKSISRGQSETAFAGTSGNTKAAESR